MTRRDTDNNEHHVDAMTNDSTTLNNKTHPAGGNNMLEQHHRFAPTLDTDSTTPTLSHVVQLSFICVVAVVIVDVLLRTQCWHHDFSTSSSA